MGRYAKYTQNVISFSNTYQGSKLLVVLLFRAAPLISF